MRTMQIGVVTVGVSLELRSPPPMALLLPGPRSRTSPGWWRPMSETPAAQRRKLRRKHFWQRGLTMAEKRLIDADTLLETIHDTADGLADCDQQNAAWALRKYAARDIMDATTVDAVEVVRCKDCKWFADNNNGEWYGCWLYYTILSNEMDKPGRDDFCSYGERKDNA